MDIESRKRLYRQGRIRTLVDPKTKGMTAARHLLVIFEEDDRRAYGKPAFAMPDIGVTLADAEQWCRNEEAASVVAEALGIGDLIGVVVTRRMLWPDLGVTLVSLQDHWDLTATVISPRYFNVIDIVRAAVLDVVIRHTDREPRNWVAEVGQPPALRLVDHAMTFGWRRRGFRSQLLALATGQDVPSELTDALWAFVAEPPKELVDLVGEETSAMTVERARRLAQFGRLRTADWRHS